jgi:hypothetical protein
VRLVLTVVGSFVFALVPSALASELSSTSRVCESNGARCVDMTYVADSGEANDLSFSKSADGYLIVTDVGATMRAGKGCMVISPHRGFCRGGLGNAIVDTGDGDDRITSPCCAVASVVLGPGDDFASGIRRADGGPGDDHLIGDEGDDVLLGGSGSDRIEGLAGNDLLEGADSRGDPSSPPADDVLDGGAGDDLVSYQGVTQAVTVDLPAQRAGSDGETDQLVSVEGAIGGLAGDIMAGDPGRNLLFGGGGEDRLVGGDGSDRLIGGSGFDRFIAGAGNDILDGTSTALNTSSGISSTYLGSGAVGDRELDAKPEPLECGAGRDSINDIDGDLVPPTCEQSGDQSRRPIVFPDFIRPNGRAQFTLPCVLRYRPDEIKRATRCDGRITLKRIDTDWYRDLSTTRRFSFQHKVAPVRLQAPLRYDPTTYSHYAGVPILVTISYRDPIFTSTSPPSYLVHSRYLMWLPPSCDLSRPWCGMSAQTP